MNFKTLINSIFTYTPKQNYEFEMLESDSNINNSNNNTDTNSDNVDKLTFLPTKSIYSDINSNIEYIQTSYNTLINSDIILRKFCISIKNKKYNAFLFYIDGMIDSNILNDFILKPLMLLEHNNNHKSKIISESMTNNNIKIRKIRKNNAQKNNTNNENNFDLSQYLFNYLIPQNNIKISNNFEKIFSGVNSGNCALFVDTLDSAFDIDIKGFKQRSIDSPNNEIVVKGSQESFVENIRTNTSIIRRIVNNKNLIIENIDIGKISQTKCGICYMNNIANSDLVAEVKYRLNNLGIDSLISSGELEQLISDENELRNSRNNIY